MKRAALVMLTTWLVGLGGARAQEAVTVEQVVRFAREESPVARALRAELGVADAEIDLAGVYPNPVLAYAGFGRFDGSANAINGTQHQLWFDVPLLLAGQHDARRAVAAAAALTARAEADAALLDLEVDVRRAFLDLLTAQEREARLASARDELADLRRVVEQRAGAGAQSQYDSMRIAVEMARVQAVLAVTTADLRAASTRLAALVGRSGWSPRAQGSLDVGLRAPGAIDDIPAVRAARARVVEAERDVDRAERERVPEVRLGAGAYFTTDGDSSSAFLGLAIPLPVFDTGEAAVRQAQAARASAQEAQRATVALVEARLEGALSVLEARRAALATFDADTFARLPELQQMAEDAYRLGASGVFELLDAFGARLDVQLARIELQMTIVSAEIDVLEVAGP